MLLGNPLLSRGGISLVNLVSLRDNFGAFSGFDARFGVGLEAAGEIPPYNNKLCATYADLPYQQRETNASCHF